MQLLDHQCKRFFGLRYLWLTEDRNDKEKMRIAKGIRADVDAAPAWLQQAVEDLKCEGPMDNDTNINCYAGNMYPDPDSELRSHFDNKFIGKVWSLSLGSDSRLVFGGSDFSDSSIAYFSIDLPKWTVTAFETDGFCGLMIKHSIKPLNLSASRGVLLFRTVADSVLSEAERYKEIENCKKSVLKQMCRQRGLPVSGNKFKLIKRILNHGNSD